MATILMRERKKGSGHKRERESGHTDVLKDAK